MKQHPSSPDAVPARAWFVLIGLAMAWGTSYILIKKGLVAFSPEQVACLRIGITTLVFLPVILLQGKQIDWTKWKQLLVVGFLGSLFPSFLYSLAQTKISSSLSGVLSSLTPLFSLLLGILFFGVRATWPKVAGVMLGLAGAIWLLVTDRGWEDLEGLAFGSLVVGACFCYAISSNVVKAFLQEMPTLVISAVSYIMVGLPAIAYLFGTDFVATIQNHPVAWESLGYVAILAVSSTVLGSLFFFQIIKDTNVVFASTVSYLIPIVAILWGTSDGEQITLLHFGGIAVILCGVYISRK